MRESHEPVPICNNLHCVQSIEVDIDDRGDKRMSGLLGVGGKVMHILPWIKHGQTLAWEGPLCCGADSSSEFSLRIVTEKSPKFNSNPALQHTVEFPASLIQVVGLFRFISNRLAGIMSGLVSIYTNLLNLGRTTGPVSVVFTFFNRGHVHTPSSVQVAKGPSSPLTYRALEEAERLCQSRGALEHILDLGITCFPTISEAAVSSCRAAYQAIENWSNGDDAIEELIINLADTCRYVGARNWGASTDVKDVLIDMVEQMRRIADYVTEYMSTPRAERTNAEFISVTRRRVQDFVNYLQKIMIRFDVQLEKQAILDRMEIALKKLKPVGHSTHHEISKCLPGTRKTLIDDICIWVGQEFARDRFLWISGRSGVGKTSVAASVCSLLDKKRMLGTGFFCKWDDPDLRDPKRVISTVVYRLAEQNLDYRELIASQLKGSPGLHGWSLRILFERLMQTPLATLKNSGIPVPSMCIIVDAVDECEVNANRVDLFLCLLSVAQLIPWLKVIVTSRPNQDFEHVLYKSLEGLAKHIDISVYSVSHDISTFMHQRIATALGSGNGLDDPTITSLTAHAGGRFVWADIACRFILNGDDPQKRAEEIIAKVSITSSRSQLDSLYSLVLESAADQTDLGTVQWCLGAVVSTASRTPLSIDNLEKLLGSRLSPHVIRKHLGPVIYEDNSQHGRGAVRICHRSFIDYVTTQERSIRFFIDLTQQDIMFSKFCLMAMGFGLKFDICELKTSYTRNCDIPDLDSRIASLIKPHLSYSCQYWIGHVLDAGLESIDTSLLRAHLCSPQFFYWIEVLSLLGKLQIATSLPQLMLKLAHKNKQSGYTIQIVRDAYRFIQKYYGRIATSGPCVYSSALDFSHNPLRVATVGKSFSTQGLVSGLIQKWEPHLQMLPRSNSVLCVGVSPRGQTIVSGSQDNTLQLWDIETATPILHSFIGHSSYVWSVAFSPDGSSIVSGSHDKSIRLWSAGTGYEVLEPLMGHSGPVLSVVFSSDGRHIVSGSYDLTVRVWDARTGSKVYAPFEGHSGPVTCVAASPDGHHIVSGSFDRTLRIWDPKTGASVQLVGHSGWVRSIAFSPDGRRLVSGSFDMTLRVWDICVGRQLFSPIVGHSGPINCVAFSPDGLNIASGSSDGTVRFWNGSTGDATHLPVLHHSRPVLCAPYLFDGFRLVSCALGDALRLWDITAQTGG